MSKDKAKTTSVKDRKGENLLPLDRKNIKAELVDYMITQNKETSQLPPNEELIGYLLPHLAKKYVEWKDVMHPRAIKKTEVYSRIVILLKNEKAAEDDRLNKKVTVEKERRRLEKADEESEEN